MDLMDIVETEIPLTGNSSFLLDPTSGKNSDRGTPLSTEHVAAYEFIKSRVAYAPQMTHVLD